MANIINDLNIRKFSRLKTDRRHTKPRIISGNAYKDEVYPTKDAFEKPNAGRLKDQFSLPLKSRRV
jgi:hypothetical protein